MGADRLGERRKLQRKLPSIDSEDLSLKRRIRPLVLPAIALIAPTSIIPLAASQSVSAELSQSAADVHGFGDSGNAGHIESHFSTTAASLNPTAAARSAQVGLASAAPFVFKGNSTDREYAVSCLAAAAWYEAGNDPGSQRSVIQVVLNRLRKPDYPKTVCGVVFEGSNRQTGCQFTFTCDGSLDRRFPTAAAWQAARLRAQAALDGKVDRDVAQATHYHADYVSPSWSDKLRKIATVGQHIFYADDRNRQTSSASISGASDSDLGYVEKFAGSGALHRPGPQPKIALDPTIFRATLRTSTSQAMPGDTAVLTGAEPGDPSVRAIDTSAPSGRWAVNALDKCRSSTACNVVGYPTFAQASRNRLLPPGKRDRPVFLFSHDAASGKTVALWDCTRVERPSPTQCLPDNNAEVAQLMHNNHS